MALLRRSITRTALPCERGTSPGALISDIAGDADQRFDVARDFFGLAGAAAGEVRRQLDLYRHGVERTFPRQYDLVVRRQPRKADQHGLHLRRIDVHPADDEHVVIATGDAHDANVTAPARTRFVAQPSDIARPIANHRQRFLGERGDDQLAGFADRQRLQGLGIDDFEDEMVFPTVQAGLRHVAFAGDAGPHDFRQAVDVDRLEAQPLLKIAAHRVAPRFGAEEPDPQRRMPQIDPLFQRNLGDVERVGRRGAQHVRPEVAAARSLGARCRRPTPERWCSRAVQRRNARRARR